MKGGTRALRPLPVLALALLVAVPTTAYVVDAVVGDASAPDPGVEAPTFKLVQVSGRALGSGEPGITVARDGTVYVVAPSSHAAVWRSDDGGLTFTRTADSQGGGGDADLAVGPDGVVYVNDLLDRSGTDNVPVSVSFDRGATYPRLVKVADPQGLNDRQWIEAGPEGVVYVSWRHGGSFYFTISRDHGLTYAPVVNVGSVDWLGPLVVGPDGTLYAAATNGGDVRLFRSHDQGATWLNTRVGMRGQEPMIFPVAAADRAGNVYVVWADGGLTVPVPENVPLRGAYSRVRVATSVDGGRTFRDPLVQINDPARSALFPWIAAGEEGRVDVAYYVADERVNPNYGSPQTEWRVEMAQSLDAHAEAPTWERVTVTPDPIHVGSVCTQGLGCCLLGAALFCADQITGVPKPNDRRLLDYIEMAIDADGNALIAYGKDTSVFTSAIHVMVAKQTGGTRLIG